MTAAQPAIEGTRDTSAPVFLISCVRSGSTLMRHMLDSHPQIALLYEARFLVDRVSDEGDFPPIEEYWDWLGTHRVFRGTGFEIDRSLGYADLARSFLEQKRSADGKPVVGATVHRHFDRLPYIWPDARYIHLLRDGRDVARSRMAMGWAGNGWVSIERWIEVERLWERFQPRLSDDAWIDVRFEDLITEPEATLTRLCRFMGLEFDEAMFDYTKSSSYERPDPRLIAQWKKRLSRFDTRLVEARAGELMKKRGYEPSDYPPLRVSKPLELYLRAQSKCSGALGAMKKYGPRLYAERFLSNRLPIKGWRDSVKLRLNEVDNRHLK